MTTMALTDVVVTGGVDTHQDQHVAAALDQLGRVLGTQSFPTTVAGYRQLLGWLSSFGSARPRRASICASSRSDFVWLCEIARSLRALATTTAWPSELTKRETHGLCVPVSMMTVAPG